MKKLSNYQKAKIVVDIIESIKQLPNKENFYIREDEDDVLMNKIAKKSGISTSYSRENGIVDISEYIQLTYDDIEDRLERMLNKTKVRTNNHGIRRFPEFKVSEELKQLTEKFEKENIPGSGPCKTTIGEMFRAMQRIQYRAYNDGDMWFIIGTDSFMSYMYLISMIDKLNWSSAAYNEVTGEYKFEFTDDFLQQNSWDGRISDCIDHSLAKDAEFIKYQLMDLLSNEKIKDTPNEYDSRSYSSLKRESEYRY